MTIAGSLLISGSLLAQLAPPPAQKKVQIAILFDTSNSMDGLIDQAKSRIWNIVNEVSTLRYEGQVPTFEIALYEYGNDGLKKNDDYIRQVLGFTSDLDDVSQKLFSLTTNGGSEYCGSVIKQSVAELTWSENETDLKMIYIAGNEGFDQGSVDYKDACIDANKKNVYINTIFCGGYDEGVHLHWMDGANCSQGDYFNIDSDKAIEYIESPYDSIIGIYNDSLNTTYYGYGSNGRLKKEMQMSEDMNAVNMAASVSTERTIVKAKKASYNNASWDLLDAVDEGRSVDDFDEKELPEEFQNKSTQEKEALLEQNREDRDRYQKKIAEFAVEREKYVEEERKRRAEKNPEEDDFGTSVNKAILEKATQNGFNQE